ncbi:MAG: serine/threonine-protein kinase [Kofleriaceae bacterium]|nr:serine/threonine-protein kinase [Kofleriaceae bacterium]
MSVETAAAEHDPLIGVVLGSRYQIESKLGEGAMGAVYKAKHVKVGRPFAVKVLHSRLVVEGKTAQRFEREAELAGRLRHPNVVGVVDVGETADGQRYMVMDFAAGQDLAAYLGEVPFPRPRIISLVRQLLEGLFHAHEAGLIHRDFKPENVIIEKDDHGNEVPRIVDFGIAILREGGDSPTGEGRLTTNGLVLGTPHYMAPEQAIADPIDHRIDLFALGIVVYEMLSGKLPFDGSGAEVARANLVLDPPPIAQRAPGADADPLLEAFARKLMAKRRDERPANAKVARELLDLIERDPTAAAAALNVSSSVVARAPAHTAPAAAPRRFDPNSNDTFPPPLADATPRSGSVTEAEQAKPAGGTTALTDPLDYDEPPRKQRPLWLFAAGGALLIGGVLGVAVLASGGDDKVAKPPEKLAVAPPPPAPMPTPTPPPSPTPQPTIETVEPTAPAPPPTSKKDPVVHKKQPKPQPVTKIEPAPVVAKAEPPTPPPPAVKKPPITVGNLVQRYYAMGEAVMRHGSEAQRVLYKRIQIQDAQSDAAKQAEAIKILSDLEAKLPAR